MHLLTLVILLSAAACGATTEPAPGVSNRADPGAPAASGPAADDAAYGGMTYGGRRYDHTPELRTFHALLAPLAAAPVGPKRLIDGCAASVELARAANAITTAPGPGGVDAEQWNGEAQELAAIAQDFAGACTGSSPPGTGDELDYDVESMQRSLERLMILLPPAS